MKSRQDAIMVKAFLSIYADLEAIGHKPKFHVLDNECSHTVQNFLKIKDTTRQNGMPCIDLHYTRI